jgi:hypothetical protein
MVMDCAQFEEIVHELERVGTHGFARRREALAHAESCERCGVLLDKVISLDFALDSLAVQDAGEHAPARVQAALLAEFKRQHAEAARPRPKYTYLATLAAAAALILAVGIEVPRWIGRKTNQTVGSGQHASVTPKAAANVSGAQTAANDGNSAASESEYATNFVALPDADDPGTLEGGTVVRVTLSRAALASFGLPVADMSATDRIPADIALSEDGVPQAIRLVASADLDQSN